LSPRALDRPRIFLSHSDRDRTFVSRLAKLLEHHRIAVWYSRTRITAAQEWHDEIGKALGQCNWFVIVLTPASVKSPWTKRELMFALRQKRYEKRILPILLQTCRFDRLSWTLESFQMVDFRKGFDNAAESLLRTWRVRIRPPRP
jgi:hypothetical protein